MNSQSTQDTPPPPQYFLNILLGTYEHGGAGLTPPLVCSQSSLQAVSPKHPGYCAFCGHCATQVTAVAPRRRTRFAGFLGHAPPGSSSLPGSPGKTGQGTPNLTPRKDTQVLESEVSAAERTRGWGWEGDSRPLLLLRLSWVKGQGLLGPQIPSKS